MVRLCCLPQEPPEGLLSLLLPSGPAAAPGAAMDARLGMPQLQHLALIFPPRSVLPPTAPPPDALSTLTQVNRGQWPRCMPVGTRVAFLCWNMERTSAAGCRHRPAAPRACMHAGGWCAAACWKKSTALGLTLHGSVSFCMFLNGSAADCARRLAARTGPHPPTPHTQLTALKLMRYPATSVPSLASLTNLRHLLWDPALPADEPCECTSLAACTDTGMLL